MKKALKILLILLLVAALALVSLSLVLRNTAKESVTPLVKFYAENPSPALSKIWLRMYGYEITYSEKDAFSFDNDYWSGTVSRTGVVLSHYSFGNAEAEAGAVIGELVELCGAYQPMGNGIAFNYGTKLIYVTLPSGMINSTNVTILANPGA